MLISARFYVKVSDYRLNVCLAIAIPNKHYNAVRLLVKHGASESSRDSTFYYMMDKKSPIVVLASQPNAPLDLFDMLVTHQNLNDYSRYKYLPRHEAASYGNTKTAQHLIKLGARVDQMLSTF